MKPDDEYVITRTFSIKIKLWKMFTQKVTDEGLGISEVLTVLISEWLNAEE